MAILKLLLWPNPELKQVSEEVDLEWARTDQFKELLADMGETMLALGGVGISAVQVGVFDRVFVMRDKKGGTQAFINPVITQTDGELEEKDEGCLSIPGIVEKVKRYPNVIVEALDPETGERKHWDLGGIEAQCAQHEIEHLDGKLFADKFGAVKRDIVKRKIKKFVKLRRRWQEYVEALQ